MAGWSARALSRHTGIPAPTVAYWIKNGLVSVEQSRRGRGGHIVGVTGLMELLAVDELRKAGISMADIRTAMENLRTLSGLERPFGRLSLVIVGSDIAWRDEDQISEITISTLRKPGQRIMVFPVGEIHHKMIIDLEEDTASELFAHATKHL